MSHQQINNKQAVLVETNALLFFTVFEHLVRDGPQRNHRVQQPVCSILKDLNGLKGPSAKHSKSLGVLTLSIVRNSK
jgi:hypothetical protein